MSTPVSRVRSENEKLKSQSQPGLTPVALAHGLSKVGIAMGSWTSVLTGTRARAVPAVPYFEDHLWR